MIVSSEKSRINMSMVVNFLSQTYWAKDLQREQIEKSINNSSCFGLYQDEVQIGFARVITDYVTLAWLADVFILPDHQKKGYGQFLINAILNDPLLKDVRKWRLASRDAQEFYNKFGFVKAHYTGRLMELNNF